MLQETEIKLLLKDTVLSFVKKKIGKFNKSTRNFQSIKKEKLGDGLA